MRLKRLASSLFVTAALFGGQAAFAAEPENTMIITLKDGDVVIGLRPDIAPKHVEQIKALVREGAYDNVAFHRVIDGFMAQTGDVQFGDLNDGYSPDQAGMGGSSKPDLPAEFSAEPYVRGTVGMARSQNPDSANSQFFIMFAPNPGLNGQYADAHFYLAITDRKSMALETVNFAGVALNFPPDRFITAGSLACFTAILPSAPVLVKSQPPGSSRGPLRDSEVTSSLPRAKAISPSSSRSSSKWFSRFFVCARSSANFAELISTWRDPR